MAKVLPVVIFTSILLLIDWYSYQAVRLVSNGLSAGTNRVIFFSFWMLTIVSVSIVLSAAFTDPWSWNQTLRVYLFAFVFLIYISKFIVLIFLLVDDIWRLLRWIASWFIKDAHAATGTNGGGITRLKFLSQIGLIASGILFFNLVYGIAQTAFNFRIRRVKITLPNLPDAFNGLKIVQISDIHAGTFTRKDPLHEIPRLINHEKPDLVFFTGDLVNNLASEMEPFMDVFNQIKTKLGVYSIFGNHDYGDYHTWNSVQEKADNLSRIAEVHRQLGWNLLRNENVLIGDEGEQLAVIGMENWSALRNFSRYGNMQKAYAGSENAKVKLLLSHDPTHWDTEVSNQYKDVDVTFAGHTHGFQFGIEIPGFRWSPAKYVYPQWAGLYQRANQYLYVNRGVGCLLYPGRVGIDPEITLFELVKAG